MANDDIPGFDTDDQLESLLTTPVSELDEDTRIDLQRYKARKLKAKRDAGMSEDRPDWWGENQPAPERADAAFGEEAGDGAPEPAAETDREPEPSEEAEPPPEEAPAEAAEEPSEAPSEEESPAQEAPAEVAEAEPSAESAEDEEPAEAEGVEPEPAQPPPEAEGPRHAGKFRIHVGPDPEDLPGFEANPELEELLDRDIMEFDEERRQQIQLYRARKIKAMRDAGIEPDESTVVGEGPAVTETAATQSAAEPSEAPAEEEAPAQEAPAEAPEEPVAEEAPPEEPEEEVEEIGLTREDLGTDPSLDELIEAGMIDDEIERDDNQGMFITTVERKKAYLSYSESKAFLTLHNYQIPRNVEDEEWEAWVKDALTRAAFAYAEENGLVVIPQNPEVSRGFLQRHPEYFEQVKETSPSRMQYEKRKMAVR